MTCSNFVMIRSLVFTLSLILGQFAYADLVTTEFSSGGHSYRAEGLSNFKYPFITIHEDTLLLVTHASTYWDNQKVTWPGINPLIKFFKDKNLPLKYLVSLHEKSFQSSLSFPDRIIQDDFHPFQGDSHRIILRGKNLILTGGNFTICACNAARSIIALSETSETLNVYFVLDGIYEGQQGITRTLFDISEEKNDNGFIKYLRNSFFNSDGLPCKDPSLFVLDRSFIYRIYRNGKFIGSYGNGRTPVNFFFKSSHDIIKVLQSQNF